MCPFRLLSLAFDPSRVLAARGLPPDPWQHALLRSEERQTLLCCSRQAGKSTAVSALALHAALFRPGSLVLLLSPSLRQSAEIFRKVLDADDALGRPVRARRTRLHLEYANGSRVVCLPGREDTIRGFGGVSLLVIDEAARVPDDLYRSVRPMLAVSRGRLVALSTPFGQRGWFWREWTGGGPFLRVRVTWRDCPRISPAFIDEERRALGDAWVAQEYETAFTALEGLVYPGFAAAITDEAPPPEGRQVGGIDFGWRNPFAAVWGRLVTAGDVLWITHERHARRVPLHAHAAALSAAGKVLWHADPSGATEIEAGRAAGLKVLPGRNALRAGIDAVTGRLETGRLRVHRSCAELIREAGLYRYPGPGERVGDGEGPVDEHNHALAALRYLVAGIDQRHVANVRRPVIDSPGPPPPDDHLWTPVR